MSDSRAEHLKSLGSQLTRYKYDEPDASILEVFENPLQQGSGFLGSVHIEVPEFTSLCPKTGQPDFATIVIDYIPNGVCIESKSLKLYLMGFRMYGEFHESCVQRIAADLVAILDPISLSIQGRFTPRGGIPFWPTVDYERTTDE
jgi:7-cyano-7-deazaguanine reductase